MTYSFKYFAGQFHTDYGTQTSVLSPLPVTTGIVVSDSEYLAKKTEHYIDIGGVVGTIFQVQLVFTLWFTMLFACIGLDILVKNGTGNHFFFNMDNLNHINNKIDIISLMNLEIIQFFMIMLFITLWLSFLFMQSTRDLRRQLPLRFHRQRREVMFSRWNKKTRKIETKVVPWEEVIAFVNCKKLFFGAGVIGESVLVIGANDETQENTSWASIALSSISPLMVAKHWEMIRRFMEEGSDAIGQPKATTFDDIMEEFCVDWKIPLDNIPFCARLWKEINFTRIGILATRYRMWRCYKHPRKHAEFEAWSQPLPKSEWARPSKELTKINEHMEQQYRDGYCSSLLYAGYPVLRYLK
ncbi:hypothetical protein C0W35_21815 [Photobacterium kishitanii]|uniref:DUF6708 domain-containing protein n=1 Tax=Photobacterium kishitanii TaxID=318456 RepID=UPI000D16EEF5|nr:DUF6708 domain-containing protein [Photobacterium kishitanii]PSU87156.1 hypothetical protein C0W35_21815 [Photobacterium kishitanii]